MNAYSLVDRLTGEVVGLCPTTEDAAARRLDLNATPWRLRAVHVGGRRRGWELLIDGRSAWDGRGLVIYAPRPSRAAAWKEIAAQVVHADWPRDRYVAVQEY